MGPRFSRLLSRLPFLCLLALLMGMQLVFWQDSQDPFNPIELAWAKIFIPLALLPLFIERSKGLKSLLSRNSVRFLFAWILWLWITVLLAPHREAAAKNALEFSLYACLFPAAGLLDASERRRALWAFLGACAAAAFYGILQHFGMDPWAWSTNFAGRPLGTLGNPDFFGGHLVLAWGASLGLLVCAKKEVRWPLGLLFLLFSLVQYFSRTVGVWLGMAGSLFLLWLCLLMPFGEGLRQAWKLERRHLLIGAAAALFFLSIFWGVSRQQLKSEKAASVTNRLMMWKVATRLWESAPLQGIGLTEFRRRYADVQAGILSSESGWNYVVTWLPHENFLYLLCETGLLGLLLYLGIWIAGTWEGLERLKAFQAESWAALLACSGMLGVSLLNTFMNIPPSAMAFFFLLGLLALAPYAKKVPDAKPVLWPLLFGAFVSMLLGLYAGREIAAHHLIRQALRQKKANDLQGAALLLQKAAQMDIKSLTPQEAVGAYYELGDVLRQGGALDPALQAFRQDLEENPNAPETHNMMGAALGQEGKNAEAIQELSTAIRLSPGYSGAMLNLGIAYVGAKNLSGAAEVWSELLKLEPDNQNARNYLSTLQAMRRPK